MPADNISRKLDRLLLERYPQWRAFAEEARALIPSGVAHDGRFTGGPVLPVAQAIGPLKRDIAGNEFVDFWMGHGSLILGHGNARVVEAVREQAGRLTHAGGCHELEHKWARLIIELVPSAERVRFTMSGTETVMLALRLARVFTGRDRVLRLDSHFHGWSDFTLVGIEPPFERPSGGGWSRATLSATRSVPADADSVREALLAKEFACLILEPTGGTGGAVPLAPEFLADVREITRETETVLIFDEIITGFRVSPGGAQGKFGVLPDLTCLGKIVAGGLPGAAVAGRAEVMEGLVFSGDRELDRREKVAHWGTFNANPLSAAAGAACLEQVRTGKPGSAADDFARSFREELGALFERESIGWRTYGDDSVLHVNTAPNAADLLGVTSREARIAAAAELKRKRPEDLWLKKALWLEGVDWPGSKQAWTSCTHGASELRRTVEAFKAAIARLRKLGAKL